MPLAPGEVVFTDKDSFKIPMPTGKVVITSFHAEVKDDQAQPVALSEVYNHHWLIFDGIGNAGVCGDYLSYIFGVGAESRNTPVVFPKGYGHHTTGTERWTANIHLLRTVDLVNGPQGVKDCIECNYYPGRGCNPSDSGHFACCGDGSFCAINGTTTATKNYYLEYTVEWTTDVANLKPVLIYVLDASNCQIEYNIDENPSGQVVTELQWASPQAGVIIMAIGHVHIGGYNISVSTGPDKQHLKSLCVSAARYGTKPGVAGDEQGYMVQMGVCSLDGTLPQGGAAWKGTTPSGTDKDYTRLASPVPINKGDIISVTSHYSVDPKDTRSAPIPGGAHGGVMSLMYLVAAKD